MTDNSSSQPSVPSHFPAHEGPRIWVLSSGDSPIGIALARQALLHGDYVVAGVRESNSEREDPRSADFEAFHNDVLSRADLGYGERLRARTLDIRMMSACQAIIAEAINIFGKVDIVVCCTSQTVVGSVEELAASERTLMLVRDQFETNYFGPVNIIKAALPHMRKQKWGHLMVTGGITGHIGTPGLGVYCAAGWALEGYCDSLAYEIAPFNIRVTILQSSIEIGILTNLITSVPPIFPAYSPATNHAPLFRGMLNGLLSRLPNVKGRQQSPEATSTSPAASASSPSSSKQDPDTEGAGENLPLSAPFVVSLYPPLSPAHLDALTQETVHAITAIGGHENPPARHIIGSEGVASVKEKLKTVSEELEDFIECSSAVDINNAEESAAVPRTAGDDIPMPMNL